jgi:hypothetical protein
MRCLLRKACVAAAVQDGKFVQEFRTGTSVDLHGIGFGGDRRIQKVELSFDKERAGQEARIVDPATKISWSLWNYVGCDLRPASTGSQCVRPTEPVRCPHDNYCQCGYR